MTLTRLHLSITVMIALVMHGSLAMWLTLPSPSPLPLPQEQALRVSLLASIAETVVNPPPVLPEPPPKPAPPPRPAPDPIVQEAPPEKPAPEPEPEPPPPEPRQVEREPAPAPQPEAAPEIVQPSPPEVSTTPLDETAMARYEQLLIAWLEKHKKYPRRAKRLRIEGEGSLRILIDRTGRTLQVALEERTGNRLLDKAALEMTRRADPFPPMPENDPRQEMEFIVPVSFVLR